MLVVFTYFFYFFILCTALSSVISIIHLLTFLPSLPFLHFQSFSVQGAEKIQTAGMLFGTFLKFQRPNLIYYFIFVFVGLGRKYNVGREGPNSGNNKLMQQQPQYLLGLNRLNMLYRLGPNLCEPLSFFRCPKKNEILIYSII